MKGLVFREFLGMVENQYGYETVDTIIENSRVPSKGVYTSVGTYKHTEMLALLNELSIEKKISVHELLYVFGKYLFTVFAKKYPEFFLGKTNAFDLLAEVEGTIHVEVLKLYPEAELPTFEAKLLSENEMTMLYKSRRSLSGLAAGLIEGCVNYYNETARITTENIEEDGSVVLFRILK